MKNILDVYTADDDVSWSNEDQHKSDRNTRFKNGTCCGMLYGDVLRDYRTNRSHFILQLHCTGTCWPPPCCSHSPSRPRAAKCRRAVGICIDRSLHFSTSLSDRKRDLEKLAAEVLIDVQRANYIMRMLTTRRYSEVSDCVSLRQRHCCSGRSLGVLCSSISPAAFIGDQGVVAPNACFLLT